jgi:hypothetical protein
MAPIELNTWMLGNTLVAVSKEYSLEIMDIKILLLCNEFKLTLRLCPLGNTVYIIRQIVIPMNK